MRRSIWMLWVLFGGAAAAGAQSAVSPNSLSATEAQARVVRALQNEREAVRDLRHAMRYIFRKTTPRLSTTREIYETRDGDVAMLLAVNDQPLDPGAAAQERARLQELAVDPARQRHRQQSEAADTARAIKVLRALPTAFLYEYAGPAQDGSVERFTFRPNPAFSPPDLETQVLTAMKGEIWIDPVQQRVVRLTGTLQKDVSFGWGILGRLNKGGWIVIEQADVGGGVWRIVRLQLDMSGRIVFRTRRFNLVEVESNFEPIPPMTYGEAIARMLASPAPAPR